MAIVDNLREIIECKEDEGKLYIIVYPQTDKDAVINVFRKQYEQAINGNLELVKKVIDKSSGQWECVGNIPIAYPIKFNDLIDVKITSFTAYMRIKEVASFNAGLSLDVLKYRLKQAGVVHGINDKILLEMISEKKWDTEVAVACGTEPIEGRNGSIDYKVSVEKDTTPLTREDGTVDFREISTFKIVRKGEILATAVPAKQGINGMDIFGNEILAQPVKEYELKPSTFVAVSEDGKNLFAEITGILTSKKGYIFIRDSIVLNNVDFDSGNIKIPVKIIINGNVNPGFVVESESDIIIHGTVESANIISTNGSITIGGGVSGKDNTLISAKNEVRINFVQNAKIECLDGTVIIESYIRHCNVTCKDFKTPAPNASAIGGRIEAVDTINVSNTSNQDGVITDLVLFNPAVKQLTDKKTQLQSAKEQLEKLNSTLEKEYKNKLSYVKMMNCKPNSQEYIICETAKQKYDAMTQKLVLVEKNITAINEALSKEATRKGHIAITGKGYSGTRIQIGKVVYCPKGEIYRRRFYLDGADIASVIIV
ncbi:MAG: FapA family protein [Chitinispirillales bacterium]|jgi:uncharacterized protein (DUF342 family)|nr:FapA family protein [Chitinispirillales bacterium]